MKGRVLVFGLLLAAIGTASAQTVVVDSRMGGYAYDSPYNRLYNPRTQITFTGRVTGVQRVKPMNGMTEGVTILVKNDVGGGTAVVDLGPSWFVDRQVAKIQPKQSVQVTGSKVMVDGRGVILAKLVKANNRVLALRRPSGSPYWDTYAAVNSTSNPGPDPNVIEITGTVQEIRTFGVGNTEVAGMVLQTANGNVTIDLGPSWYYQQQGITFPLGTNLSIGYPGDFVISGGRIMPAYWLRGTNGTFGLRDPLNGRGYWLGGGG